MPISIGVAVTRQVYILDPFDIAVQGESNGPRDCSRWLLANLFVEIYGVQRLRVAAWGTNYDR